MTKQKMALPFFALFFLLLTGLFVSNISYQNPNGSIIVEERADRVLIDNGVLEVELLKTGVRAAKWRVKSTGLEFGANAGTRGDMGESYPLWDWISTQTWPGELCTNTYTFRKLPGNSNAAVLEFNTTLSTNGLNGLRASKRVTFYLNKYYIDVVTTFENPTDSPMEFKSYFDNGIIGYTFAWSGVIGTDSTNDLQGWNSEGSLYFDRKEHFVRDVSSDIRWATIYDIDEDGIAVIIPQNGTKAIWRESDPGWGTEIRVEYPPQTLGPKEKTSFSQRVYAGPIDATHLGELGLEELLTPSMFVTVRVKTDRVIYNVTSSYYYNTTIINNSDMDITANITISTIIETQTINQHKEENVLLVAGTSTQRTGQLETPNVEGVFQIKVQVSANETDIIAEKSIDAIAVQPGARSPLNIAFVWHHHQSPNFQPNGTYNHDLPFIHAATDEFKPHFEGGAYLVHTTLHQRHPNIKDTDHVSPSLLYQWLDLLGKASSLDPYIQTMPPMEMKDRVNQTLENFKSLVNSGNVEVLTSYFAHPVAGYCLNYFQEKGLGNITKDLLVWEIEYGKSITNLAFNIEADGMWTPEMFWDMQLVDILNQTGIEYTVLCEQHFTSSVGNKSNIYEPYTVKDSDTGKQTIVFFRDLALSNTISFDNTMPTEEAVDQMLRNLLKQLYQRYVQNPGKVVVIALDGENWMLMSGFPPNTAVFLDRLWGEIEKVPYVFKTVTLAEALNIVPPQRVLTHVPTGSWIGLTASQWTDEFKDELWSYLAEKLSEINSYMDLIPDSIKPRIYMAFSIAIDSDFFWYAEENQAVIRTWADEAVEIAAANIQQELDGKDGALQIDPVTVTVVLMLVVLIVVLVVLVKYVKQKRRTV